MSKDSAANELVTHDVAQPHVSVLTMRHSQRLNAINAELAEAMVHALGRAVASDSRVAILRAEPGVSTWSAGHDIDELPVDGQDPLTWSNSLEHLLRKLRSAPIPVIAAVEGGVWGGACDLVMSVDLVVACESSTFAITPTKLGVPYNTAGVSHFLAAMPVHIAKEMFFTADPITAQRAYELGIVNRLASDPSDLEDQALTLARRVACRAPLAVRAIKAEIHALTDASPMTSDVFEKLTQHRRTAWASADYREGLLAFSERRAPNFTGD